MELAAVGKLVVAVAGATAEFLVLAIEVAEVRAIVDSAN